MYIKPADTNLHSPMPNSILPHVIFIVSLMLILHCPLLRVKVNTYSVLGERLVIVHGLVVHSAPSDDGSQLTEVGMLLGSFGWVHCRVMLLSDPMVAVTFAENGIGSDPTGKIIVHFNNHNNTIYVLSILWYIH